MTPAEVGESYDRIAERWRDDAMGANGVPQHERAIAFTKHRGHALDVGCGCSGRFFDLLRRHGFAVEGVDLSEQMVALARQRDPEIRIHHADIREWTLLRKYDLITGWDSIWHVPLADQAAVLGKLCAGLTEGGVLLFTLGGLDQPNEVRDANMGVPMYHATLGIPATLALIAQHGCVCRHLEYDQWPEQHAYVIAQKLNG